MCFIVPKHIFESLAVNGTPEQRSFAQEALTGIARFVDDPARTLAEYLQEVSGREAEEEIVDRRIHDAENRMTLPGKLIRKEGEASNGDVTAEEAYNGSGTTYDFFQKFFGRNSIDGKGMPLISTVHYGRNFGNAFWNGSSMTYGDGDGEIFQRFTILDVIAHETAHGVTERTAGLIYANQPGALNESFSDVFGSCIKQYFLEQTAEQADWLIGEGLFTKKVNAKALRSMSAPGTAFDDKRIGKDRQVGHMKDFIKTGDDNGGVHWNSGIPNKAFHTTAMALGGKTWESGAAHIWYKTLLKLRPRSQFQDAANASKKIAAKLYGVASREEKAVVEGWKSVGIQVKG